jgi:hypothetical protein
VCGLRGVRRIVRYVLDTPVAKVPGAVGPIGPMSPVRLRPTWVIVKLGS